MKKWIWILLAVGLVMMGTAALAETLPESVAQAFETDAWAGYTPVIADKDTLRGKTKPHVAVIMQRGDHNVLCLLEPYKDGYVVTEATSAAIYQGDTLPSEITFEYEADLTFCTIAYGEGKDITEQYRLVISDFDKMFWNVTEISLFKEQSYQIDKRTTIIPYEMYYGYWESNMRGNEVVWSSERMQRAYGVINRRLLHFDINTYPRSHEEGLEICRGLPAIEEGEQQFALPEGVTATLAEGVSVPVYAGPGEHYLQIEGLRAETGMDMEALGAQANFIMVRITDADGKAHVGYVAANAFASRPEVDELIFAYLNADVEKDSLLLDAAENGAVLASRRRNQRVLHLGTVGSDWAYVEIEGETPVRGFVPTENLTLYYELYAGESETRAAVVFDAEIIDEPYMKATPEVLGTVQMGDQVLFVDNLYGEWALVDAKIDGETVRGYVPRDAVEPMDGDQLESNG